MKDCRFKCLLLRLTPVYGFFDLRIVDKITHIARLIFCFKHTDIVKYSKFSQFSSVQFIHSVMSDSSTPWTAACQASLSITNSQSLLKLMSIESVMPSNYLILCRPLLLRLQSFLASGSSQMSQFFTSGGQSIGVSALASVLPMNSQD